MRVGIYKVHVRTTKMPALTSQSRPPYGYQGESDQVRTINFSVDRTASDVSLGFNIRGGSDFGLGIFVSDVVTGTIAAKAGFRVGDEILEINGHSFKGYTHADAVDFITSNENLSITVRSTGRVPEEEQFIGKPSWITSDGGRISNQAFATEDLYTDDYNEPYSGYNNNNQRNLHIKELPQYSSPNGKMSHQQQTAPSSKSATKAPSKKKNSQNGGKGKDSVKGKKGSKKKGKVQKKAEDGITTERDQLVNVVMDKLQIDFSIHECGLIRQAIALYHNGEAVDDLLNHILGLFTPKKYGLLREIRKVIYADEVERYDSIVFGNLQKMKEKMRQKELGNAVVDSVAAAPRMLVAKQREQENGGFEPDAVVPRSPPVVAVSSASVSSMSSASPVPVVVPKVDEIVMKPTKSSYKAKHGSVKEPVSKKVEPSNVIVMKPVVAPKADLSIHAATPPQIDVDVVDSKAAVVVVEQPTIKPFVPFVPEPYVLYDKDKNPVQKLVHGVRLPANSVKLVSDSEVKKYDDLPNPNISPSSDALAFDCTQEAVSPPSPAVEPLKVPVVKKVVQKVETTTTNKVVAKKTSDHDLNDGKTLLTIEKSSFDEASNTVTIDATLNRKAKAISAAPVALVERTDPKPIAVSQTKDVTVEKTTVVKETNSKAHVAAATSPSPLGVTVEKSQVIIPAARNSAAASETDISVKRKHIYHINKSHRLIGLSISGGADSRYQREIRVVNVAVDSAASAAGLQVGQVLLAIDEHSLEDSTHSEACHLIRSTFRDKTNSVMVLKVE